MSDGSSGPRTDAAGGAERFAFVTLATSDSYVDGALVLLHSLRRTLTRHSIVCLATPETLSSTALRRLREHFDGVIEADLRQSSDDHNLALLGRPDLRSTLTKIHLWDPALFGAWSAVCYLDADTLVRQPIDDVFERFGSWRAATPEWRQGGLVAAAPDTGWPDCFNSGVLLLAPGFECHQGLLRRVAQTGASFDGADQGLLNEHFADWAAAAPYRRLPFLYNATANVYYTYEPALQRFGNDVRVVHFIGVSKPWHWERTPGGQLQSGPSTSERWRQLVSLWWNIHDEHVSGWTYWKGSFDKPTAFGRGYHHITEPVVPAHARPETSASGHGGSEHDAGVAERGYADVKEPLEVPDWDKDWEWATDRVHPFDYAYLTSHAKSNVAPAPTSTDQSPLPQHAGDHGHYVPQNDRDEGRGHVERGDERPDSYHHHHHHHEQESGSHMTHSEHTSTDHHSPPQQVPTSDHGHEPPQQHQHHVSEHRYEPPSWMQSQRPWEDVAREGWMHNDEYQPHTYDQSYIERHIDQHLPQPAEHHEGRPEAQHYQHHHHHDQHQESHHQHQESYHWQPEYTPMPVPRDQPLYEAAHVVLQPHDNTGGSSGDQWSGYEYHGPGAVTDHHDHGGNSQAHHYSHSDNGNHGHWDDGSHHHHHHRVEPVQVQSDEHTSQDTTKSSPLYYPQPKSPLIVNPVALWESDEEQARRRAWAQQVKGPEPSAPPRGTPWATDGPSADQHVPPSAMDYIDSSQLPRETPWKISHVRHRPPEDGPGYSPDEQSPHKGMQFKEGVANDSSAREAAGQILRRWNEAVIARSMGPKGGSGNPGQISHSAPKIEKGTDAIRLETTISCEAEDASGERTVYRFTLSSTLDVGGSQNLQPPHSALREADGSQQSQATGQTDESLGNEKAVDVQEHGVSKGADITDLRQPENYQEPAISRRSSFVQLQRGAPRAPHTALRSGYDNGDQFAESDARYWKLQRQLIDLEMNQRRSDEHGGSIPNRPAAPSVDVAGQDTKIDMASPPTPSYPQTMPLPGGPGYPLRRRPSAFSVADPAALDPSEEESTLPDTDPLPNASVGDADEVKGPISRRRSRSSPPLDTSKGRAQVLSSAELKEAKLPSYPRRSRSHSTLRRIAVKNRAQAQVQIQAPKSPTADEPKTATRPVFVTSAYGSGHSDGDNNSDKSSEGDSDEDGSQFKPASARMPTPFPRSLRGSSASDSRDTASVEHPATQALLSIDPARSRATEAAGSTPVNFGLPLRPADSTMSPGKQKIRPKMNWDDDGGASSNIPAEDDRSLDAQWRRIIYGAPRPRALVVPPKAKTAAAAAEPTTPDDTPSAESKPVEAAIETSMGAASAQVPENVAAGDDEADGDETADDGDKDRRAGDGVNAAGRTEEPAVEVVEPEAPAGTRAPPRRLPSQRSFLNLTSKAYDVLSDSELDSNEVEQQELFWARAMKPSKSGMSTPYSPGRRKSVAEMSSLISPRDLEEWMQWQDDGGSEFAQRAYGEAVDVPRDEQPGSRQSGHQHEPITPPVSKTNAFQSPGGVADRDGNVTDRDGDAAKAAADEDTDSEHGSDSGLESLDMEQEPLQLVISQPN
ncbi:glycogenin glucosyltransferase [Coemansia sp. RSA 552]|nr:glycogenin glucosyltransferase [Coemansia sp. RSA 552]